MIGLLLRKYIPYLFWVSICQLFIQELSAQKDLNYSLEQLTTEQGLASNDVMQIFQDNSGFIWILSSGGLSRYDGYQFKNYGYNPGDTNSISPGWLSGVMDYNKNRIWISGEGNQGIYSFDISTEKLTHYSCERGHDHMLMGGNLNSSIALDKYGIVWIAGTDGLLSFNPTTKIFRLFNHIDNDPSSLQNNNVEVIESDEEGNLWIVMTKNHRDDIDYFDVTKGKVIAHITDSTSFLPSDIKEIEYNVTRGKNGNMWFSTEHRGLYGYNIYRKRFIHIFHDMNKKNTVSYSGYGVLEDHSGNLWMYTDSNKLYFFDSTKTTYDQLSFLNHLFHSKAAINKIFEDHSGRIWMATGQDGIYSFDPAWNKFGFVSYPFKNGNYLPSNNSFNILQTRSGRMLLTHGGIVEFIKKGKDTLSFEPFPDIHGMQEKLENIYCLYEDHMGTIWFCTGNGLLSFNPLTRKKRWYRHADYQSATGNATRFTGIIQDTKGRYWITTWLGVVESFEPSAGTFHAFRMQSSGQGPVNINVIANLYESSDGTIYVGSLDGGFINFNPDSGRYKIFRHQMNDTFSLNCDIVFDFYQTKNGLVWLATNGGGINVFDPQTGRFKSYTTRDGLVNNKITSITPDNNGNLWLGTEHGLSVFTPPEDPFSANCKLGYRTYDVSDGLPSNNISICTGYKTSDGVLYFGTNNGFFYFSPDKLSDNTFLPPISIVSLQVFDQEINPNDSSKILSRPIEYTPEIRLAYNQNSVSFGFAALNYNHPEKNKYSYQLEGFDNKWIYTDADRRFANYTNLPAGEYVFKVRGSNNDGHWNESPASVVLIITPPFWLTWWFISMLILTICGILYSIYRYRILQIIRLQTLRNNIAIDLHDEIGSTLNSISILSSVAKLQAGKSLPALEQIGENSRSVVESMNDIVWTINPENDNFEKILIRMRSFAHQLMKGKLIEFRFDAVENIDDFSLPMKMRKNIYLIFKEATINMAKYSMATNAVFKICHQDGQLQLTIQDDGIGFDTTNPSPGNGIKNMNKRALEINAVLKIESTPGQGTNIELTAKI